MSTILVPPPSAPAETTIPTLADEPQRLLLHNVSWDSYCAIGNALVDRPSVRLTYDRGNLEIMTTSKRHEHLKYYLGRFVDVLAEETGRLIAPGGSMTFQREDIERGLESDNCYWIAHEQEMRERDSWDPLRDPPPDLVLEIEVSRTALNKMGIYAALRVPEVWRLAGVTLGIYVLQPDGTYRHVERSPSFPDLSLDEIPRFLQPGKTTDYLSLIQAFRAWVCQQLEKK